MSDETRDDSAPVHCHDPIHAWFSLTRSAYLVVPRLALQSLPRHWQQRFVDLLEEAYDKHGMETPSKYEVRIRGRGGRFVDDPWADYRRGDAKEAAAEWERMKANV